MDKIELLRKKLQDKKRQNEVNKKRNEFVKIAEQEMSKGSSKYSKIQQLLNSDEEQLESRPPAKTVKWICSKCNKEIESFQRPPARKPECNDCIAGQVGSVKRGRG